MNDTKSNLSSNLSPGEKFRQAMELSQPLPIVGTINPYCAMMAEQVGHKAIYLAGGGLATHSHGLPDLAVTTINDVLTETRRLTDASSLPLLVDVDTGFGGILNIQRLVKGLIKDGAAAMHIEDQVQLKRCGHRPGKRIVPTEEMIDRIKATVDSRTDHSFVIVARTDALAVEGIDKAIERACLYIEAGADMIFAEACTELDQYTLFSNAINRPHSLLANITEFSLTPTFTLKELSKAGVSAALFPLSAARAMAAAALNVYQTILRDGTQKNVIHTMQSREELYKFLSYEKFEKKYDTLYGGNKDGISMDLEKK